MLGVVDFGSSPHAREFGDFGPYRVRFGKAGAPPKPRTLLTVWPWTVEGRGSGRRRSGH